MGSEASGQSGIGMASGLGVSPVARHIELTGVVQGVGFRPFVYNLAVAHGLRGWV